MGKYDFIIDNIVFSFSGASSFNTCPYGYKLAYIDGEERVDNFYSDYGKFIHLILEKYFKDELSQEQLYDFYIDNYFENVKCPPPAYPANISETYYADGKNFFKDFIFDKSKYKIISIEDSINSTHKNFSLIVKPDLILKNLESGKYILVDYKTSKYKKSKVEDKKITEYKKQMAIYAQFLYKERQIEISEIQIWFIRTKDIYSYPLDLVQTMLTMEWFSDTIQKIKIEKEWRPNNTKENSYFCNNLCGVRNACKYKT